MSLAGKRALVTGGSRGLGSALCVALAAAGARVAFTYTRDEEGADATALAIRAAGSEAVARRVSVLDGAATKVLVRELDAAWGGLDVLINNAGVSQNLPLALMQEADWDLVMGVNVKGAFITSRAVLPGMIRRKSGVILNVGSVAGERVLDAPVHYCASKAALRGMTQAMAKELGRHHIRVVCLAPGLLEDGASRNLPDSMRDDYLAHCALGRPGTLDEVARFAAFLVSDASSFVSGETIVMDGGL